MKRRSFIKKAGLATAGVVGVPYILPTGRLFAKTGARKVNHVVFCMYAGGVRNIESIKQDQSNLMETMLRGNYIPKTGFLGANDLPNSPLGSRKLQEFGTLYKEFRFKEGPTGHFNGHTTALTGRYLANNIDIRTNPQYPTIFEYYRKHNSPSKNALNAWWVSDSLGAYPALNYSQYTGYGATYGANFIQPGTFVNRETYQSIGSPKDFLDDEGRINTIRNFLNNNFKGSAVGSTGIVNTPEEAKQIETFFNELYQGAITGADVNPYGFGANHNNDLTTIFYSEKILQKFQPELLVLNLTAVDTCHDNFTRYCNNMRKADWGVSHLWNTIQSDPVMRDNTVLIVSPEHGRNFAPNTLVDEFGRPAFDHTSDDTSREIFCMICGPQNVIKQNQEINTITGESVDIVPTISDLLGFSNDIPSIPTGRVLNEAYV